MLYVRATKKLDVTDQHTINNKLTFVVYNVDTSLAAQKCFIYPVLYIHVHVLQFVINVFKPYGASLTIADFYRFA